MNPMMRFKRRINDRPGSFNGVLTSEQRAILKLCKKMLECVFIVDLAGLFKAVFGLLAQP